MSGEAASFTGDRANSSVQGANPVHKCGLLANWRLEGLWWDVKLLVKACLWLNALSMRTIPVSAQEQTTSRSGARRPARSKIPTPPDQGLRTCPCSRDFIPSAKVREWPLRKAILTTRGWQRRELAYELVLTIEQSSRGFTDPESGKVWWWEPATDVAVWEAALR